MPRRSTRTKNTEDEEAVVIVKNTSDEAESNVFAFNDVVKKFLQEDPEVDALSAKEKRNLRTTLSSNLEQLTRFQKDRFGPVKVDYDLDSGSDKEHEDNITRFKVFLRDNYPRLKTPKGRAGDLIQKKPNSNDVESRRASLLAELARLESPSDVEDEPAPLKSSSLKLIAGPEVEVSPPAKKSTEKRRTDKQVVTTVQTGGKQPAEERLDVALIQTELADLKLTLSAIIPLLSQATDKGKTMDSPRAVTDAGTKMGGTGAVVGNKTAPKKANETIKTTPEKDHLNLRDHVRMAINHIEMERMRTQHEDRRHETRTESHDDERRRKSKLVNEFSSSSPPAGMVQNVASLVKAITTPGKMIAKAVLPTAISEALYPEDTKKKGGK